GGGGRDVDPRRDVELRRLEGRVHAEVEAARVDAHRRVAEADVKFRHHTIPAAVAIRRSSCESVHVNEANSPASRRSYEAKSCGCAIPSALAALPSVCWRLVR